MIHNVFCKLWWQKGKYGHVTLTVKLHEKSIFLKFCTQLHYVTYQKKFMMYSKFSTDTNITSVVEDIETDAAIPIKWFRDNYLKTNEPVYYGIETISFRGPKHGHW